MPSKLTPKQATELLLADAAYWRTKRAHDEAKERRKALLEKYADRLPAGEWVECAGRIFRRSTRNSGDRFSLTAFLAKHKLTKAMAPFVSTGTDYDILEIKAASK